MRRLEAKVLAFLIAIVISGIVAAIINNWAINAGYDTMTAFKYALGSFFVLLLIFYGLIRVAIKH